MNRSATIKLRLSRNETVLQQHCAAAWETIVLITHVWHSTPEPSTYIRRSKLIKRQIYISSRESRSLFALIAPTLIIYIFTASAVTTHSIHASVVFLLIPIISFIYKQCPFYISIRLISSQIELSIYINCSIWQLDVKFCVFVFETIKRWKHKQSKLWKYKLSRHDERAANDACSVYILVAFFFQREHAEVHGRNYYIFLYFQWNW